MANTSRRFAGNLSFFDAIVTDDGLGDYSSPLTAFSTEGADAKIYVKGDFTETAVIEPAAGQIIYWDDVTLTCNTDARILPAGAGTRFEGKLTLTGTGESTARNLIATTTNDHDWSNCKIILNPTGAGLTGGSGGNLFPGYIGGVRNRIRFSATGLNFNSSKLVQVTQIAGQENEVCVNYTDIVNAQDFQTQAIYMIAAADRNLVKVVIDSVTTTVGTNGYGVFILAGGSDNTLVGVVKNCDGGNLSDSGTNNNTAALNTA